MKIDLDWYHNCPESNDLSQLLQARTSAPVPADWIIYLTDVSGSTKAIDQGKYKDVNTVGCLPLMALANYFETLDFPFVFGGDGVTLVLPPEMDSEVRRILIDTQSTASQIFDLSLRLSAVRVADVYARGAQLAIARLKVSDRYSQAVFYGDGLDIAEKLLKDDHDQGGGASFRIVAKPNHQALANFEGFSCRWKDVPSPKEITVALLLKPGTTPGSKSVEELLRRLQFFIGDVQSSHPLSVANQSIRTDSSPLRLEAKLESWTTMGLAAWLKLVLKTMALRLKVTVARFALAFNVPLVYQGVQVNLKRQENMMHADTRKFDGLLKLVAAVNRKNLDSLKKWLDEEESKGRLNYGIHESDRALMTCMVHSVSSGEVHFIDAADGGYALAARQLKLKLARS